MLRGMQTDAQIGVATQAELRPALTLVLRTLPADQRAPLVDSLARLRDEPLGAFQALVVAREKGELKAVCWGQPQPGKGCSLWTPQAERGEVSGRLAQAMIRRMTEIVDQAGVHVTQTLSEVASGSMHAPLVQCGFNRVAELHYLSWTPAEGFPETDAGGVTFEPYDPRRPRRMERLLAETYQQTLDFPELDGMRDLRDVVHGYQCLGEFRAELWSYLVRDGEDLGALLLAEYPESNQLELVYMGVAPAARGRNLGEIAVSHGQQTALDRGIHRMVLAVDARNHIAAGIYRKAGFRKWAQRFAYLRAAARQR